MTAFAGVERTSVAGRLACELRAVNHRFLDVSMRLPEELRALEPRLRERIAERVNRGKVDVAIRLVSAGEGDAPQLNPGYVERLSAIAQELDAALPALRVDLANLLQLPGLLQARAVDQDALFAEALALVDAALDDFVAAREREGAKLCAVIAERVDGVARIAAEVRTLVPMIREGQRAKLAARMGEVAGQLDPGRLEQELVLWLQKLDVDEELDRLDSHVAEARRVLKQREPVGRRLDFLLQEFNREANTLGSKSVDVRTSNAAVELKVLIDQIREQVQNIE
ncbi:YicC family protein [Lysobacter pythonis]|uniref:YicC family protein n=1 Tax=Solilutibacter pythonis TaxID=2483112 RepID=A0A3M2I2J5_9GAMM|nr:YicC/YloC family endoribonuclease [Lysobacter pythonis]RMH93432.1 YicC family protein [Lysobacter pythonis]